MSESNYDKIFAAWFKVAIRRLKFVKMIFTRFNQVLSSHHMLSKDNDGGDFSFVSSAGDCTFYRFRSTFVESSPNFHLVISFVMFVHLGYEEL